MNQIQKKQGQYCKKTKTLFCFSPKNELDRGVERAVQCSQSGTGFLSQFDLFDHRLTPQTKEQVVSCQCRHGVTGSIRGTSNMW